MLTRSHLSKTSTPPSSDALLCRSFFPPSKVPLLLWTIQMRQKLPRTLSTRPRMILNMPDPDLSLALLPGPRVTFRRSSRTRRSHPDSARALVPNQRSIFTPNFRVRNGISTVALVPLVAYLMLERRMQRLQAFMFARRPRPCTPLRRHVLSFSKIKAKDRELEIVLKVHSEQLYVGTSS